MIATALVFIALGLIGLGLGLISRMVQRAPVGEQDETGFHPTQK